MPEPVFDALIFKTNYAVVSSIIPILQMGKLRYSSAQCFALFTTLSLESDCARFKSRLCHLLTVGLKQDSMSPWASLYPSLKREEPYFPLTVRRCKRVDPRRTFSPESSPEQGLTVRKQRVSSILKIKTRYHVLTSPKPEHTNDISASPRTASVMTQISAPEREQTRSKPFILLSLPRLRKYQIAFRKTEMKL